jgi:hypothetical protein
MNYQVFVDVFLVVAVRNATDYEIVGATLHLSQGLSRHSVP